MKRMGKCTKSGFTLVELLVSITIIMVLTVTAVVNYGNAQKNARDAKRKADLEQIRAALEMYKTDNHWYPNSGSGNWTNVTNLGTLLAPYLSPLPFPPKTGEAYYYKATNASGGKYYGYCLSSDMEASNPPDSCTPYSGHEYGLKSP